MVGCGRVFATNGSVPGAIDSLPFTVPSTRKVHRDGIRFQGMRYIDPTLAAYVGEDVLLRCDPRDMAEVRVFMKTVFFAAPFVSNLQE